MAIPCYVPRCFHTFAVHADPTAAILAAARKRHAKNVTTPAQICAQMYFPVPSTIAPAIGGPAKDATPTIVATMPKRTPIF